MTHKQEGVNPPGNPSGRRGRHQVTLQGFLHAGWRDAGDVQASPSLLGKAQRALPTIPSRKEEGWEKLLRGGGSSWNMHGEGTYKGVCWLGILRAARLSKSSQKHLSKSHFGREAGGIFQPHPCYCCQIRGIISLSLFQVWFLGRRSWDPRHRLGAVPPHCCSPQDHVTLQRAPDSIAVAEDRAPACL